jgi:hypothetical protein
MIIPQLLGSQNWRQFSSQGRFCRRKEMGRVPVLAGKSPRLQMWHFKFDGSIGMKNPKIPQAICVVD